MPPLGAGIVAPMMTMRRVLERLALDVVFQPIVELERGTIVGYESLGRAHALPGLPPPPGPAELLDLAHADGMLLALDRAWRRIALERIAEWPGARDELWWFLNVDTRGLDHPRFAPGYTRRILEELGIPRTRVVIELGERDPGLDAARLAKLAPGYGEQGFPVAIDDFGVGHASIAALLAIRPQFLKLDRTLVRGVGADSMRAALVASLVELGARTDMAIVAEGIETEDERAALRACGVRYGQGFLLGRPAILPITRAA